MRAYRAEVAFDGDAFLDGGALVFTEGGLIVGVEPRDAPVPDGVEVEEVPGGSLLPGLVNTHTHLCADGGPLALDQLGELTDGQLDAIVASALAQQASVGVTTVRDLGDRAWFVVQHRDPRPGLPRVLASGPPITVAGGHCANMGGAVEGAPGARMAALRAAVDERAERGADVVKVMGSGGVMTPGTDPSLAQFELEELRATVEAAHGHGLPVTVHAHALQAVRYAVAAGADGIEHCTCMTMEGPVLPPDLLDAMAAARIAVCPTLGRVGGELPERTRAAMVRFRLTVESLAAHFGTMLRAGVRMVAGDDSGINPDKRHGVMPSGVAELLICGASVPQALAAATGIGADALGLGEVTGRLRPGLAADLLLVRGDPRVEIEALARPARVVVRGQPAATS